MTTSNIVEFTWSSFPQFKNSKYTFFKFSSMYKTDQYTAL